MAQNGKLKLNFTRTGNNYAISKRQATSEPEIVAEPMDMDSQWNLKSRDENVKKGRKDQTITNVSLSDLDKPQDKWLTSIPVSNQFWPATGNTR
ncbi:hypothetical protein M0802_014490 [Mischocyttarus mexicanus]|nr:hypothetical protein M0802_014490 [Mischocyttarus mexicanus]